MTQENPSAALEKVKDFLSKRGVPPTTVKLDENNANVLVTYAPNPEALSTVHWIMRDVQESLGSHGIEIKPTIKETAPLASSNLAAKKMTGSEYSFAIPVDDVAKLSEKPGKWVKREVDSADTKLAQQTLR